ncbi:MAG: septum site-determining protein MinC [Oscillospiraceae bacterium]|nr:septum site-determining protein MinC [Oscillospiraceae bacterium]
MNEGIVIKGSKDGINIVIDFNKFRDFDQMATLLRLKLRKGSSFYKNSVVKITTQLKDLQEIFSEELQSILFNEYGIKECIFEDMIEEKVNEKFIGIYEGKTKFIKNTIRSGQLIEYSGNIVIIGDANKDSEVKAGGNVIVLGILRGDVYAGVNGNNQAIIAASKLMPRILGIDTVITRSPEESENRYDFQYPEIARLKDGIIIVEPYLVNKYYF